jgi:hypothetical protein
MTISVNWATKIITVQQADCVFISAGLYSLDVNAFRLALKNLEDDVDGMAFADTHTHNTEVTISGVTLARVFQIINGYTITFQDTGTPYTVKCTGANHNIGDVKNVNQVSLVIGNSAGLIATVSGSGVTAQDKIDVATAVRTEIAVELARLTKLAALSAIDATLVVTPTTRTAGTVAQSITTVGDTTTVAAA